MARQTQKAKNKEYQKQRDRVRKLFQSVKRRGYFDAKNRISDEFGEFTIPTLSELGGKVTKSLIDKLKKITPDWVYRNFYYSDPNSGETLKGTEGRKVERKRAAEKAAETRRSGGEDSSSWGMPIPNFDYAAEFIERVASLPDYYWAAGRRKVYYTANKNSLFSIIRSNSQNNNAGYQGYLMDNWGVINATIETIDMMPSDNVMISTSYTQLINIANAGIATLEQQQSSDMYEDEEEDTYD